MNFLQRTCHNQVLGLKPWVDHLSPSQPCPQDTSHAPQEPYLGRVECCDDPHTVCVVVILNGEIGGSDDARGASKVGITHAGCREKWKFSFDQVQLPSPPLTLSPEETEVCPNIAFCFLFSSLMVSVGVKGVTVPGLTCSAWPAAL